jgi:hypothetical protein
MMQKERYIGDGLYASFDGYHFILRAPKLGGDHTVMLEPSVLQGFERFVRDIQHPHPAIGETP